MTNELQVSIIINESAGDVAKICALSEKLRRLADYLEKDTELPNLGCYDNMAYCLKELNR